MNIKHFVRDVFEKKMCDDVSKINLLILVEMRNKIESQNVMMHDESWCVKCLWQMNGDG